jgi:glycine/D-amino acid oxidase-like deaminating enzyme
MAPMGPASTPTRMRLRRRRSRRSWAEGIECDFRRRSAYLYAEDASERRTLEREAEAAREAGLTAELLDSTPLPYDVAAALRFPDQAEIHPGRYLAGLAEMVELAGGEIFESTTALSLKQGETCEIETDHGVVSADHVVVATLLPFLDRGGFFARFFSVALLCGRCLDCGRPARGDVH